MTKDSNATTQPPGKPTQCRLEDQYKSLGIAALSAAAPYCGTKPQTQPSQRE